MNVDHWQRVKLAFAAAVEAEPHRRGSILDRFCAGDPALRLEVCSLIAAHESVSSNKWLGFAGGPSVRPEVEFTGNSRFQIAARLGAGGFGVVYRARDGSSGRDVALKVLRQADPAGTVRFKREFRMLADLAHPNLVRLFELFVEPDRVFFTMELIEGKPLTAALATPGRTPLDPAHVAQVFLGLAGAVRGLHAEGVVHRDLKPSNVLVTEAGRVVVLDFGLAADFRTPANTNAEGTGWACGTPAYMAPEQFQGLAASPASDWYGVGSMLFETLTGHLPFSGDVVSLAEAKRSTAPALPRAVSSAFPVLGRLAEAMLSPSPAARPDGETVARVLAGATGSPAIAPRLTRSPLPSAFVGRESELGTLREAWARVRSGDLAVVCVRGTSGMGKTSLVRRFLEELGDTVVLAGRCHDREAVGYNALDGVVDGLSQLVKTLPRADARAIVPAVLDDLARVFPVLRTLPGQPWAGAGSPTAGADPSVEPGARAADPSSGGADHRRRAFDALRDLLVALARRKPCVVFIDDLQWGDKDSAALLRHLVRPPDAPPLLVLAACRGDESSSPSFASMIESLRQSGRMVDIALGPLGAAETRDLATRLLGEDRPSVLDAIVRDAGGVPFFVDTLVEHFQDPGGPPVPAESAGEKAGVEREVDLQSVLSARVGFLPAGARRLLEVVALAGTPLGRSIAHQAAGLDGGDQEALEHLLRARHLLRLGTDGVSIETYHDRIRDAVIGGLAARSRPELHRNIAQALSASGRADPEDLALHFAAGGQREAAADHAVAAARRRSQSLAFDRAAELFQMAIELNGTDHPDLGPLKLELADALAAAGRSARAADAYLDASVRLPSQKRDARFKAAVQYLRSGHFARGRALMGDVLRGLGWRLPRTTAGALLAVVFRRAQLAWRGLHVRKKWTPGPTSERNLLRLDAAWTLASNGLMVGSVHASYYQAHNLLAALDEGEPFHLAQALGLEAILASLPGARSPARADRILRLLHEVTEAAENPVMTGLAALAEGVVAANRGQWTRAHERSLAATKLLGAQGSRVAWELSTARSFLLGALVSLGEFREFSRIFPGFLDDSRAREDLYAESILVLSSGAYIVPIRQDRVADAQTLVDEAVARLPADGYQVPKAWAHFAKVDIALYAGDVDEAWRLQLESWPRLSRSVLVFIQTVRVYLRHQRGRTALAVAERRPGNTQWRRLIRVAESEARALEREDLPWARGLALGLRAGVAMARDDRSGAAALLAAAMQQLGEAGIAMHVETGRLVRGHLIGGSDGRRAIVRAETWMRGQEIACPDRVARTVYPGFGRA